MITRNRFDYANNLLMLRKACLEATGTAQPLPSMTLTMLADPVFTDAILEEVKGLLGLKPKDGLTHTEHNLDRMICGVFFDGKLPAEAFPPPAPITEPVGVVNTLMDIERFRMCYEYVERLRGATKKRSGGGGYTMTETIREWNGFYYE